MKSSSPPKLLSTLHFSQTMIDELSMMMIMMINYDYDDDYDDDIMMMSLV